MTTQVNGLNQAVRNFNDAIFMIEVGQGALKEITNLLQRMRALTVQTSLGYITLNDRIAFHKGFTQLRDETSHISANSQWHGVSLYASG